MMIDIPKLIEAETNCLTGSTTLCRKCPYLEDKECVKHLIDDLTAALKRLQFLEKLAPEEQPMLPGVEYIDRTSGRVMSEREMYEHLKNNPEKAMMFEKLLGVL